MRAVRRRVYRAFPASVHRGKRTEGSREMLDVVFCADIEQVQIEEKLYTLR